MVSDNFFRQMHFAALRETVQRYKENPEEVSNMCEEIEDWLKDERAEGRTEGRTEGVVEILKDLVKDGTLTVEKAAKKMGVTVTDFRKMAML